MPIQIAEGVCVEPGAVVYTHVLPERDPEYWGDSPGVGALVVEGPAEDPYQIRCRKKRDGKPYLAFRENLHLRPVVLSDVPRGDSVLPTDPPPRPVPERLAGRKINQRTPNGQKQQLIRNLQTGEEYDSQLKAALAADVCPQKMRDMCRAGVLWKIVGTVKHRGRTAKVTA